VIRECKNSFNERPTVKSYNGYLKFG